MVQKTTSQWYAFDGLNVNYLLNQYDRYLEDSSSVDESLVAIFRVWQGLDGAEEAVPTGAASSDASLSSGDARELAETTVKIYNLISNIRAHGHRQADVFPLEKRDDLPMFELDTYNLTTDQLEKVPGALFSDHAGDKSAAELIDHLSDLYINDVGFDFAHLDPEEVAWFQDKIESGYLEEATNQLDRDRIVDEIFRAEGLEQYLQKFYMSQKRFSGEGLEALMPVMNQLVALAGEADFNEVYISMAHRGRLNALVHVLDQSYEWLLAKFEGVPFDTGEESDYDRYNSTGDVKYHLGAKTTREYNGNEINITMANNPSHLEFVNSVEEGMARASQDIRNQAGPSQQDVNRALPILVHGDAAFVGQGVNYETFNYSEIEAYQVGGSVHIIANNTIGFTTYNDEQFATEYPSDPFKGFGVPVLHLNADHPESAVAATRLAFEYRQTFHKDIIINLIGYRRLGHNELDEPRLTNPRMYQLVDQHDTITGVYSAYLTENGLKSEEDLSAVKESIYDELEKARQNVKDSAKSAPPAKPLSEMIEDKIVELPEVDTSVDRDRLAKINETIQTFDDDFKYHRNLQRVYDRRKSIFEEDGEIDWSLAEALAWATILQDGTPIRLTGEDAERGTFSHRSQVVKNTETGENYTPLHHIPGVEASFDLHNSTLTETAVMGFEYGYSMTAHDTLVFWEAQFGDFANTGQVIFDQFISGGRKKWGELSGLVLLLPHGYEGAGPEHSSGRLERFLQLSAENNWTVANLSTAAQLFHILRRQAAALGTDAIRPLVIMTPKSLLRSDDAASPIEAFTEGKFHKVIDDARELNNEKIERLVLTSGRLSVDVKKGLDEDEAGTADRIAHIRVEELYPFPEEDIKQILTHYPNVKEVFWVQEEPKNMGAYAYMALHLLELLPNSVDFKYVGRPAMAAPSEGLPAVHAAEQKRILNETLKGN